MKYKAMLAVLIISAVTASLIGCGVPKSEHDKIVKQLEQTNKEKTVLADQATTLTKEKEALSKQVADLQNQVSALRKENDEFRAKLGLKKPAAKAPAKAPAKKK